MKRQLVSQRLMTLCVGGFLFTLLAAAQPGSAATITVNSVSDVQANDGVCTLREAIMNANGDNQSGSTDCAAGSGADTINIVVPGEILLTAPLPTLTTDMTINGLGSSQTFVTGPIGGPNSLGSFRCFAKTAGTATISNMTIRKGLSPVGHGITNGSGGGIFNLGPLTLIGVVVTHCQSRSATQADGSTGFSVGAGISSGGPLTLLNCTFSQCATIGGDGDTTGGGGYGGAIYIDSGAPLTITNSNIGGTAADANQAQGGTGGTTSSEAWGGGIFANGAGAITISNSNIGFNTAISGPAPASGIASGGGIAVVGGTNPVTINSNTQVSNNAAISGNSTASGASAKVGGVSGGGIGTSNPTTISDSTINANQATAGSVSNGTAAAIAGGGIAATSGLTLTNTQVAFNTITPGDGSTTGSGDGGGIYWSPAAGSVFTATGSTIKNNAVNTFTGTGTHFQLHRGGGISLIFTGSSGSANFSLSESQVSSNTVNGSTTSSSNNYGGGIYAEGAIAVTINNTLVNGNSVQSVTGGGSQNLGGGIFHHASIPMSISGSDIMGNFVTSTPTDFNNGGGGIAMALAVHSISITDCTIAGNTAPNGGGFDLPLGGGTVNLLRCTFSGNTASFAGGGILDAGGNTVNLTNSTISGNSVTYSGAAFSSGGIDTAGSLRATNSTFSGNLTPNCTGACGGAIFANYGTSTLTNCTLTNHPQQGTSNASIYMINGTVNVKNTIIAANAGNMSADVRRSPSATTGMGFVSQGYNLIGDVGLVTAFNQMGDQTGTNAAPLNPMLGGLTNNGGTTLTHLPLAGSPVIDKGAAATDPITNTAITTDQTGFPRPIDELAIPNAPGGNASEIGAVEFRFGVVLTVTKTADTNDGVCNSDCSLREALAVAGTDGAVDTIVFNIPANSPGCVGSDCTITLSSPLNPAADGGRPTTINGYTGANTITLSGNNAIQLLLLGGGANIIATNLNITGGNGGAVELDNGGTLRLTNSALFGNVANNGGAFVLNAGGVLNLANVTISGNSTTSFGSAGGIWNAGGAITAVNCTIANNSARNDGGVATFNGGTFTTSNTIIAANTAIVNPDAFGSFTSLGHNIIGNTTGNSGFTGPGDQLGANPQLAALGNNGGPTRTQALQSNSPAINAGNDTYAPTYDQRYLLRNGPSDIGAYEYNALTPSLKVTAITRMPTGEIFLQGLGVATAPHTILWSSSPATGFSYLGSDTSDATGAVQFSDGTAPGVTKRFYRLSFP